MTAKEKVLAIYPNAVCESRPPNLHPNHPVYLVRTNPGGQAVLGGGFSEQASWERAARAVQAP